MGKQFSSHSNYAMNSSFLKIWFLWQHILYAQVNPSNSPAWVHAYMLSMFLARFRPRSLCINYVSNAPFHFQFYMFLKAMINPFTGSSLRPKRRFFAKFITPVCFILVKSFWIQMKQQSKVVILTLIKK